MRLSLPFVVLALVSCAAALGSHFELPRFEMLDKDGDGSITEAEVGQFIIDTGKDLAKYGGKQIFRAIGYLDPAALDGISRNEYKMLEDVIRIQARLVLQQFNETVPQLESKVMSGMQQLQTQVAANMQQLQSEAAAGLDHLQSEAQVSS